MRLSPKRLWRTGFFVIEVMLTDGLVARRKTLIKSTEYPARPQGGKLRGHLLCQNTCKGLAIHYALFRGSVPLVIHREDLGT